MSESVRFTEQCERAISNGSLSHYVEDLRGQLQSYTTAEPPTQVLTLKLKALILDLIHSIEVVETLIAATIRSLDCWLWQKQLR